jgi:hypothetical protein
MRYRVHGEKQWTEGSVENVSTSGVLFKGARLVELNTLMELSIVLPASPNGGQSARVVSQAKVVRCLAHSGIKGMALMAAKITQSRLVRP